MKQTVAIIGGGAAALLLAAFLDENRFRVTIYEKNKSLGRKLLVAGSGGFNLTHAEALADFINRYTPVPFLKPALEGFSNDDLQRWLAQIGVPTFVGSSKRIYPVKGIKPIAVLNKILAVLERKKVTIATQQEWTGWNEKGELVFNEETIVSADHTVFALGGGSWKVTGSDGSWLRHFTIRQIPTQAFRAANCAVAINWPSTFLDRQEGKPLKNILIHCGNKHQSGEVVVTRFGMEGNAIYALSLQIQQQLQSDNKAIIYLDLKPSLSQTEIERRIESTPKQKMTDILKNVIKLRPVAIQLIKTHLNKKQFLDPPQLASLLKQLPLTVTDVAPIDEAISTTGGIDLSAVDSNYQLKALPHHYCIGEMLDWNAPTGGYLLQACFSMGVRLAQHLNELE
jgi:uncharacterized flavoprotein (TIGR03862 family)